MESTVFVLDDGEDIPLKELNLTFINDFEYFLRTEKKCRTDAYHELVRDLFVFSVFTGLAYLDVKNLTSVIARMAAWFPYFREMLRIENLCRLVGFSDWQTATLVKGKPLEYAGELYSEEHRRKFTTEKAGVQVLKDPENGTKQVLAIDRKPIAEWFKEQFDKLRQNIHRPIQPQREGRGI